MKYKFNTDKFIKLIKSGIIEDIETEQLEMFVKILPKPNEIQRLKEAIISEGNIII